MLLSRFSNVCEFVVISWVELFGYEVWGIELAGAQVYKLFVVKGFTFRMDQICSPIYGKWIPFYCRKGIITLPSVRYDLVAFSNGEWEKSILEGGLEILNMLNGKWTYYAIANKFMLGWSEFCYTNLLNCWIHGDLLFVTLDFTNVIFLHVLFPNGSTDQFCSFPLLVLFLFVEYICFLFFSDLSYYDGMTLFWC